MFFSEINVKYVKLLKYLEGRIIFLFFIVNPIKKTYHFTELYDNL